MTDSAKPSASHGDEPTAQAMIYVRDTADEAVIRQCLRDLGVTDGAFAPGGVEAAIAQVPNRTSLKLLIVDITGVADPLAAVSHLVGACSPSTGVIVLGDSNDIGLYRNLREAGVSEYFFKPLVSALVTRACDRILNGAPDHESGPVGRLILVMGVHGGSGATTIAARTAWRLAESPPRPVLLLDLDLLSGDAALQLDVTPNEALREALEFPDRIDALFLERGVIHASKHLDLLASLVSFDAPLAVNEDAVLTLLQRLLSQYRYVVVDVPATQAQSLPRMLSLPSTLLLVSDGRLASARDVRRWRARIGPNSAERSTLHILNHSGEPGGLPMDDFVRAAGEAPDVTIPHAREIAQATNLGIHAMPDCHELTHGLAPVFQRIAGDSAPAARSILARLFG